jgi:hypothetical protein
MAKLPFAGWNLGANQTMFPTSRTGRRDIAMFVQAVWRHRRFVDSRHDLRQFDVPTRSSAAILGLSASDLGAMTRGLFDRACREGAGPRIR